MIDYKYSDKDVEGLHQVPLHGPRDFAAPQ